MTDFAADIPVFLAAFGEPVTFISTGKYFPATGIFGVQEEPIIPMDGQKAKPQYNLTCDTADVVDVNTLYTVEISGVEYKIIAVTPNPVTGMTEILLGHPK